MELCTEKLGPSQRRRKPLEVSFHPFLPTSPLSQASRDSIVDVNSTATSTYFEHMLTLYSLDWLRSSLLEGYVSAAGAGADSLLRSSRLALVIHIEQFSTTELVDLCHCFNGIVEQNLSNDRVLIPTLVVLGFVFDSGVFEQLREVDSGYGCA